MQGVVDFLSTAAQAFERGDHETVSNSVSVPIVIHVGTRVLVSQDKATLKQILKTYRANLAVENYASTKCEVLHTAFVSERQVQVLLNWKKLNPNGAEICILSACYHCDLLQNERWTISAIEYVEEPHARYLNGLSLI